MRSWLHRFRHPAVVALGSSLLLCFLTSRLSVSDEDLTNPEKILQSLSQLQFDAERSLIVKDLTIHLESLFITFERGRMVFIKPVAGVVTGLYFWGEGTLVVSPPNMIEKHQLNLFTGAPTLNEHFREALVRFTDDTYNRLMEQARSSAETEYRATEFPAERFQNLLRTAPLTNYRILADLMNGRATPIFSARVRGQKLGLVDLAFDSRKTEEVSLGQSREVSGRIYYDNWCSYSVSQGKRPHGARRAVSLANQLPEGSNDEYSRLIDCTLYEVDTHIDRTDKITAGSSVEFVALADGEWVVNFDLSRYLKVSRVTDEKDRPLAFYQNSDLSGDEEVSKLGHDIVLVVLKEALRRGETRKLHFEYTGDVISRAGSGIFYVGARGSWYPNAGIADRARYQLKFQYPKGLTIVATGDLNREWEEGDQKFSLWTSNVEIPVAGFNYGDYVEKSSKANDVPVDVYANRSIENVYVEVVARLQVLRELEYQRQLGIQRRAEAAPGLLPGSPDFTDFDTSRFSSEVVSRVAKTLAFFEPLLTKYPYNKLAVSQIPGKFSQGWPSLLYVSSLAFLSREQRSKLGMETDRDALVMECLPAHELAHQWWGNLLGWKSYHDVWMMEGFSNYYGFLSTQVRYAGDKQFRDLMRQAKERIQAKNADGQAIETAGPVWLSSRLSSSKFPNGYTVLVYEKGAWILHMLRCLLSDSRTGSDERFQVMIRDFINTHRDKLVSTEDFKQMVEKHMSKDLDLDGNGNLDWFFDEWVYGTGIPTYRLSYSTSSLKNGGFLVKGKILQENVPDTFMMPVEVFGHFPPQRVQRLGRVDVLGNQTLFKFVVKSKPLKVTLDEKNEILCENKTL